MEYKTRGFEPSAAGGSSDSVAAALEGLIAAEAVGGWEFLALENHSTVVPGDAGCFGFGATQPYPKTFAIAVFRR
jgi:hypothetical protein